MDEFGDIEVLTCQQAVYACSDNLIVAELTCLNQRAADGGRDEFLAPVIDDATGDATWQIEDGFQGSADNGITLAGMRVEIAQRYQQVVLFYAVARQVCFNLPQHTLGAPFTLVGKQVGEQRCFIRMCQPKIKKPWPYVYIQLYCQIAQLIIKLIVLD